MAVLSACGKENPIVDNVSELNSLSTPIFTATIEGGAATKTTIALNTETGKLTKVNWSNGDEISINGVLYTTTSTSSTGSFSTNGTAAVADGDGKFKAFYPASLEACLPASYTYESGKFNMPMYAESATIDLNFKNICAVLAIDVPSAEFGAVTKIVVSSDKGMNGVFSINSDNTLTLSNTAPTDAEKKVTVNITPVVGVPVHGSVTFHVPIPAQIYEYLQIEVSNGTITKSMRTKAQSITVGRNMIYPIVFSNNYTDPNILAGEFSVSASKRVKFTKSNLYWDGIAFKFEKNQYDYPTTWRTDHVGHFFWTKTAAASYAANYDDGTNSIIDVPFFAQSNGGLTVEGTTGLFVLTSSEWSFLLNSRSSNLSKIDVTVGSSSHCLVIAPDGFSQPLKGSYTIEELNSLGLVCLPLAGARTGTRFDDHDGFYWASDPDSSPSKAKYLQFYGQGVVVAGDSRLYGQSIRLVKLP